MKKLDQIKKDEELLYFLYNCESHGFMKHIVKHNLTNMELGNSDPYAGTILEQCKHYFDI